MPSPPGGRRQHRTSGFRPTSGRATLVLCFLILQNGPVANPSPPIIADIASTRPCQDCGCRQSQTRRGSTSMSNRHRVPVPGRPRDCTARVDEDTGRQRAPGRWPPRLAGARPRRDQAVRPSRMPRAPRMARRRNHGRTAPPSDEDAYEWPPDHNHQTGRHRHVDNRHARLGSRPRVRNEAPVQSGRWRLGWTPGSTAGHEAVTERCGGGCRRQPERAEQAPHPRGARSPCRGSAAGRRRVGTHQDLDRESPAQEPAHGQRRGPGAVAGASGRAPAKAR